MSLARRRVGFGLFLLWFLVTIVMLTWAALATVGYCSEKAAFRVRASPQMKMAPFESLITAEIIGDGEPESLYCPTVEWLWPDDTHSLEEADCPPYAERTWYPRRWTKKVVVGPTGDGYFTVRVKLWVGGKVAVADEVRLYGVGG